MRRRPPMLLAAAVAAFVSSQPLAAAPAMMPAAERALHRLTDWTDGCIAVTNGEIEDIWARVDVGTPIEIRE